MKKTATILLASLLTVIVGCASYEPLVSMRGVDVAAPDKAPEAMSYAGKRPGTQPIVARTFSTQPPVIPHSIENFSDINLEENACMDCHSAANFKKKNAPKIGDSHFVNRDGQKLDEASAARHNCVQCHVPQVDAPPLVESTFQGDQKSGAAPAKKAVKKN